MSVPLHIVMEGRLEKAGYALRREGSGWAAVRIASGEVRATGDIETIQRWWRENVLGKMGFASA